MNTMSGRVSRIIQVSPNLDERCRGEFGHQHQRTTDVAMPGRWFRQTWQPRRLSPSNRSTNSPQSGVLSSREIVTMVDRKTGSLSIAHRKASVFCMNSVIVSILRRDRLFGIDSDDVPGRIVLKYCREEWLTACSPPPAPRGGPPCRPGELAHLDAEGVRPCRWADVT